MNKERMHELVAVENAQFDIGVTYVYGKKHQSCVSFSDTCAATGSSVLRFLRG